MILSKFSRMPRSLLFGRQGISSALWKYHTKQSNIQGKRFVVLATDEYCANHQIFLHTTHIELLLQFQSWLLQFREISISLLPLIAVTFRPPVLFTQYWMKVLPPREGMPENTVMFECSFQMSRTEIRDYLKELYSLESLQINTEVRYLISDGYSTENLLLTLHSIINPQNILTLLVNSELCNVTVHLHCKL